MKALLLDVEKIGWQLVKPEASVYEESDEKTVKVDDALVVMLSIEKDDDSTTAESALKDIEKVMLQLKRDKLVLYPYAHLSNNLADPKTAMQVIDQIYRSALNDKKITVKKAPFGWNKKWSIEMKGHPLAEQGRNYGKEAAKIYTKAKPVSASTAIVTKSIFSGLPETDHRIIGERLDLFSFQEVSPGMVYWHPNGLTIFLELVRYIREKQNEYGYMEVSTPAIANLALWQVSGHIEKYKDDMFTFDNEGESLGLKPMNCPSVIMIYKSRKWSYRDLPVRFSDFDKLYRNEISGSLSGLFRVREITQDDAHIFVREDQIEEEMTNVLKLVVEFYSKFGLSYKAKLSTMPDKHLGDEAFWEKATNKLKAALDKNGMKYEIKEKEGAFYGPKIDFDIKDDKGKEWQCATVQLDYQQPQRFGLEYTGEDGKAHPVVIIHRVIYGALERFIGIFIGHSQGKFPVWLAPVQVRVISISEQSNDYGSKVYEKLRKENIRAHADLSDRTLEYKIRDAQMQKVPYMIIVGKKEQEKNKITVRDRAGKQIHDMELSEFVKKISEEIAERSFSNEL
jgi:threonyl-tRNA synthetase